jgi:hypothetical protein
MPFRILFGGLYSFITRQSVRLTLMVLLLIGVIAGLSGTVRSPTRTGRPETAAAVLLRTIVASQILFTTSCGNGGYARSFDQLATPPPGSSDAFFDRTGLDRLAPYYTVTLIPARAGGPNDCNGHPTSRAFTATAVPNVFGGTGRRSFAVDRDGTIWSSDSPVPPTEPFDRTGKRLN